jgi:hypothetical protein
MSGQKKKRQYMKNSTPITLVGVLLIFSILACTWMINGDGGGGSVLGSGTAGAENRSVGNVTGVELATPGTLDITIGSSESFRIEADDNLLQYIQTDVRGGTLVIRTRQGFNLQPVRPIKYHLTVVKLNSLAISSSGNISAEDLKSDAFSIAISSSGNLAIKKLDCNSLSVKISSSGDTLISTLNAKTINVIISSSGNLDIGGGQVLKQTINISSSGEYRAKNLASAGAEVTLTSSGEATIRVSDSLSGRLSSSGNINYIGSPQVNVNMTSSGKAIQVSR